MSPNDFLAIPEQMHTGDVRTGTHAQSANKLVEMKVGSKSASGASWAFVTGSIQRGHRSSGRFLFSLP